MVTHTGHVSNQTDTEIGRRVDALRVARGITAEQLAVEANIPYTTLQRRLAGDGKLTVAELGRLSAILGVTAASWFEVAA